MASHNVRLSEAAHGLLRQFAEAEGKSMQAILEEALEEYKRKKFWSATNAAFQALQRNHKAWKEEQQERTLWDNALFDGLADK